MEVLQSQSISQDFLTSKYIFTVCSLGQKLFLVKKKIFHFEYLFQSSLWWIPSRASHHGAEVQITVPMNTLTSEAVTKGT